MDKKDFEKVVSPSHYKLNNGVEAIDIIRASLSEAEFRGFCKGNVLKYLLRAGKKQGENTDLQKASRYIGFLNDSEPDKLVKSSLIEKQAHLILDQSLFIEEMNAVRNELLGKIKELENGKSEPKGN